MHHEDWRERSACHGHDVELFYSNDESDNRVALRICAGCPVRADCFETAMAQQEAFGVWGGTLEAQRRRVFRREQRARRALARRADAA